MNEIMKNLHQKMANHAADVASYFNPGARVTIAVRIPEDSEREVVVSDDDYDGVIEMLRRAKAREEKSLSSVSSVVKGT